MDPVDRQVAYMRQQSGPGRDRLDVLDRIRQGTEDEKLSPAQRSRKKHKRGGTRRAQAPVRGYADEAARFAGEPERPVVFEIFGQKWSPP